MTSDVFLEQLREIKKLYVEVKGAIVLAEKFDPEDETYISQINELRNTLDHIMRALEFTDRSEHELNEAKEHLYRAGYDTYEILATNLTLKISGALNTYRKETISTVYPRYYDVIRPELIQIRTAIADLRANKNIDPATNNKTFSEYFECCDQLIQFLMETEQAQNDLIKGEEEYVKSKNAETVRTIIITAVSVLVTFALTYFFISN